MKTTSMKVITVVAIVLLIATLVFFAYLNLRAGSRPQDVFFITLTLLLPFGVLYGSLWLLLAAWEQKRRAGGTSGRIARWVHHLPRYAGLLFALFISLFALDVFEMPGSFMEKLGGFLMHAAPALVLLVFVAIAWKWPAVGFVGFIGGALFFLRFVVPDGSLANLLLFVLPLALVGMLFYADWKWRPLPPIPVQ